MVKILGLEALTYELLIDIGIPFLAIVFFLEGSLFGKLLPTDFILPAAVVLYATQTRHYFLLVTFTALSSTIGQYWLLIQVRKNKEKILEHRYIKVAEDKLEKAEDKFERHGLKAVFISNMIPGVRGFLTIPAGMERTKPWKFVLVSGAGTAIYHSALVAIGIGIVTIF